MSMVSFYAVKETLTGDRYCARYPIGATTLTDAQLRDKDYIIMYSHDMYLIGDHTNPLNPLNPLATTQYLKGTMRPSGLRNNFKLVKVTIDEEKMFQAKITALVVNFGQQLFTPYGKRFIISKRTIRQSFPISHLHTVVQAVKPVTQPSSISTMTQFQNMNITTYYYYSAVTLQVLDS